VITDDPRAEPLEAIVVETGDNNPIATVVAWLVVALVAFLVVWWVWTRWIDPSTGGTISRFVNSNSGVLFEDPNDGFSVTTPTKWERTAETNDLGTVVTVSDTVGSDYSFSVTKTPEPVSALDSYRSSLNQVAGQLASDAGATIVSQTDPVPIIDVAVKDVVYRKGDTFWHARIELLKDRLYTIVTKTPSNDDAVFKRFLKGFQILGPR
jgi:hypothetical protein